MSIKNKFNQMVKERKEMMVQGVDENRLPVKLQYLAGIVDRINGKKNILIGEIVKLTKFQTLELEDLVYDYTPVENDKWENIVSSCRFRWGNRNISIKDVRSVHNKIALTKASTGDPNIPPEVLRAKRTQGRINNRA